MNLKDNKLSTKRYGIVYCEEYVKEAVLKLIEYEKSFLFDLNYKFDVFDENEVNYYNMKCLQNESINSHLMKFKEIFGDWEENE